MSLKEERPFQEEMASSPLTRLSSSHYSLSVKGGRGWESGQSSLFIWREFERQKLSESTCPLSFKRDRVTNRRRKLSWAALSVRCDSLSTLWFCSGGCVRPRQVTDMAMMRWLLSITHCHNTAQCGVFKPSGQHWCFWKQTVASHNACLYVLNE